MFVLIIYKNQTYNIEIKEDISIINLKNLVSTKIQRIKTSFDLYYKQKKLPENETSFFEIAKGERIARIIVLLKKANSMSKKDFLNRKIELPLLDLSSNKSKIISDKNTKYNLNETETYSNSSSSKDKNNKNNLTESNQNPLVAKKIKQKAVEYKTKNKVFENIYKNKEETIINLMEELKNKILEYDDILYQKNINKFNDKNNEILSYEKNIINYKDRQIQFLKNLLKNFEDKKTLFNDGEINLKNFYLELSNFNINNNTNIFIQNYSKLKPKKIIDKNIYNKTSKFNDDNIPSKIININNNKAKDNNKDKEKINNISFKPKEKSQDSSFNDTDDDIIKEKNDKIFIDKEQKIKKINLIKANKYLTDDSNENLDIEKNDRINQIEERRYNTDKKVNKYNIDKNNFEKPANIRLTTSSKSVNIDHEDISPNYNAKKIEYLFKIEEKKDENSENTSDIDSKDSDNLNKKKLRRKSVIERNLRERRNTLNKELGDSLIGYRVKFRDRQTTRRIKKLGNFYSDFVI